MFKILRLKFKSWSTNPMIYLGFFLGMSFSLTDTLEIARTSKRTGEWICMMEPTVVAGSSAWQSLFLLLGVLMILSDSPFINELTPAVVLRTSRKRWFAAQIGYIWAVCALYYLFIAIFSMLICMPYAYPENVWSHLLYAVANGELYGTGIEFSNVAFLRANPPLYAFAITICFQITYAATLELILFFINTRAFRSGGLCIVMLIHVLGYVLFLEGLTGIRKFSLLLHALPAMHGTTYCFGIRFAPTIMESGVLFLLIDASLTAALILSAKRFDFISKD